MARYSHLEQGGSGDYTPWLLGGLAIYLGYTYYTTGSIIPAWLQNIGTSIQSMVNSSIVSASAPVPTAAISKVVLPQNDVWPSIDYSGGIPTIGGSSSSQSPYVIVN